MELALAKKESVFGATLLVAGCCIGAGMLGLPVVSASAGFVPASIGMLLSYFFATSTGLILLEATLWFDEKVSLLSIAQFAFGKTGKYLACLLFLFLYYCLFVAYIDGGGQIFASVISHFIETQKAKELGIVLCALAIVVFSYFGTLISDLVNRVLMVGLAGAYIALISFGLPFVKLENLKGMHWTNVLQAMPIFLVCFGYQNLVPSLTFYLRKNVAKVRFAIMIGNFIPLTVYFLWNFVILGLLPEEMHAITGRELASELLEGVSPSQSVSIYINIFSVLAIFTSILPNAISFLDFLEDGMRHFKASNETKHLMTLGVFLIPPLTFSYFIPHLFLKALSFAGAFADVLLLGILPVTFVWIGRYKMHLESSYTVRGGRALLILIFIMSLLILITRGIG